MNETLGSKRFYTIQIFHDNSKGLQLEIHLLRQWARENLDEQGEFINGDKEIHNAYGALIPNSTTELMPLSLTLYIQSLPPYYHRSHILHL